MPVAPPPTIRALLLAGVLVIAAAGCSGGDAPAADSSGSAAASSSSSSSSSAGSSAASDDGGASASPSVIPVLPPEQEVQVAEACTGEGAYLLPIGGALDPALPERGGARLTLAATGTGHDDGGTTAQLTAALDDDAPREVAPVHIGERFTVDMWTFSVTSICANQVELDLID